MSALGRLLRPGGRRSGRSADETAGLSPVTAGALLLAVVALVTYLGFTKAIPFRQHFEVDAVFRTSNNLRPDSPVRIAGVEVGRVTEVVPNGGRDARTARVTMRIFKHGRPLHRDATATIRPRIFLEGNFFVDLTAGTPSAPVLKEGETIPVNQTATPVQLDQVLSVFKQDTRTELRRVLIELSDAYRAGAARGLNRSFEFQPAALQYSTVVNQALLGLRPHDLSDFIRDQATVAAALDASPRQLQGLLRDFNLTAAALAAEREDLQATFAELPRALTTAGPTLDALNRSFPDVRRLAREALPGVRSSGPTIDVLMPLVAELRGLVSPAELQGLSSDLRATIPALSSLAENSLPLLEEVREASSCQNEVILPWSRDRIHDEAFPATGQVYEEAVKWLPGIAGESRSFDANGQWFKVLGGGGLETVQLGDNLLGQALFPIIGTNPPKPQGRPPLRPDVPCETQERPDLRTNPGGAPPTVSSSARARGRYAKARRVAIDTLRAQLLRQGSEIEVLDRDATASDIRRKSR